MLWSCRVMLKAKQKSWTSNVMLCWRGVPAVPKHLSWSYYSFVILTAALPHLHLCTLLCSSTLVLLSWEATFSLWEPSFRLDSSICAHQIPETLVKVNLVFPYFSHRKFNIFCCHNQHLRYIHLLKVPLPSLYGFRLEYQPIWDVIKQGLNLESRLLVQTNGA